MNACYLQSVREVRVSSDPRLLAGTRTGELLDALCVKTDNADPEDDNACTRAMKYAGCTPDRLREACIASPATPGCAVAVRLACRIAAVAQPAPVSAYSLGEPEIATKPFFTRYLFTPLHAVW